MSCNSGPNNSTNGLVFEFDMNNTKKSWKGAPTTNLYAAANLSAWNMSGGISSVVSGYFCPFDNTNNAYLVTANGTTNSYISSGGGITSGITYTRSVYAKAGTTGTLVFEFYDNNGAGGVAYFATTFNLSTGTVSSSATGNTASIIAMGDGWYRCIVTRAITLTFSGSGSIYIGAYGSGSGTVQLAYPQFEASSVASAFTASSRTNTQALLDLTGNNTLTATSLTYANDNTFSFNGSNNYVDINSSTIISGTNPYTIDAWYTRVGGTGAIFGNYGTSYVTNTIWFFAGGLYFNGTYYIPNYSTRIAGTHHICATRDASGAISVYFDGNLEVSSTNTTAVSTNQNYRIGADVNGGGEPFNGNIYSVKIYNKALTASEVKQNFNALRGRYGI